MKTALYARVSTDQQSTGLESQVRILKDYCAKNDILDYEIFMDEGISGTKSRRPALDQMMAAVNSGEISSVIVYSTKIITPIKAVSEELLNYWEARSCRIGSRVAWLFCRAHTPYASSITKALSRNGSITNFSMGWKHIGFKFTGGSCVRLYIVFI